MVSLNNNISLVRHYSNFAVPTVLAAWVYCMHSVISGIFIGRHVGADALAALNLLVPLLYLPYAFSVMIGVGGSTLVSRLLGEQREREAAEAFTQALWLLGFSGVAFALAIHSYADTFVKWTGARGELARLANDFLHAYAPFVLFPTACYALELFLRIEGAASFGLVCLIAGGIADVALTWWMVSHMQWGMRGAALASGISQALACIPMLAYHFVRAQHVRPVARAFARLDHAWRMAYNGGSEFLGEIAPSVTLFAFNHGSRRVRSRRIHDDDRVGHDGRARAEHATDRELSARRGQRARRIARIFDRHSGYRRFRARRRLRASHARTTAGCALRAR
jgi:Na+-driven multidrug efflux pump